MIYILLFIVFVILVCLRKIKLYFQDKKLGWKAYKLSPKEIVYSEMVNGEWNSIVINAHIDVGTFTPWFKDETEWISYPEWAQNRKKIIERVVLRYPLKYGELDQIGMDS